MKIGSKLNFHQVILVLSVSYIVSIFWQNKERFLRTYNYEYFGNLYSNSQYVLGTSSPGGIGDDGLYAFAGNYYISGGDISQVSFESPPLAKYLIGVSVLLFRNELVINLLYAFLLLVLTYKLGIVLTDNKLVSALASFLVIRDPLFTSQFALSMLDIPMTIFFLAGIYWFIRGVGKKKDKSFDFAQDKRNQIRFFLSAFCFSLSFTTRFFPILPVLLVLLIFGLWRRGGKEWIHYVFYLTILMPLTYLLAHFMYFRYHPSFIEFLRYQLWIIKWRMGEPFVPGNIVTTILTGHYRSWWQKDVWLFRDDWTLVIPAVFILGFIGMWHLRKKFPSNIVALAVITYLLYVGIGTVGVTKFLLPVYPIIAIFASEVIVEGFRQVAKWKNLRLLYHKFQSSVFR